APPGPVLVDPAEGGLEHLKVRPCEWRGEVRGVGVDELVRQVVAPDRERLLADGGTYPLQVARLAPSRFMTQQWMGSSNLMRTKKQKAKMQPLSSDRRICNFCQALISRRFSLTLPAIRTLLREMFRLLQPADPGDLSSVLILMMKAAMPAK